MLAQAARISSIAAEACEACGRVDPGLEECSLFRPGVSSLRGRCEIFQRISSTARRHLRARYPERAGDLEDATQEVWLRLSRPGTSRSAPRGGASLRRWLRSVVFNCVTDLFRRDRVVTKVRCGACAHYDSIGKGGCLKAAVRDPSGAADVENPWFGPKVHPETYPESLNPPCREFLWRYRPTGVEEVEDRLAAPPADSASATDRPGAEALAALARLARRGPESLRRASVVYRHYLEGEPLNGIARSLGVTARTARRDLRQALLELRELLTAP